MFVACKCIFILPYTTIYYTTIYIHTYTTIYYTTIYIHTLPYTTIYIHTHTHSFSIKYMDAIKSKDIVQSMKRKIAPPLITLLSKEPEIQVCVVFVMCAGDICVCGCVCSSV